MTLVKILKRKDGSSVVVAVLIAIILNQALSSPTTYLAGKISGLNNGQYGSTYPPGNSWKVNYLYPVVSGLLQLVVLEILAWLYVMAAGSTKKK